MPLKTDGSSPTTRKKKEDKSVVIEEKSSKPPVSKFSRKKIEDIVPAVSTEKKSADVELLSEAEFCTSLLVGGFVQAYCDFYHLTHRADPNAHEGILCPIFILFVRN